MIGNLEGKVAIITGAGQGIGAGIARVFANAGAKVMVATRTASHGEATVEQIASYRRCTRNWATWCPRA